MRSRLAAFALVALSALHPMSAHAAPAPTGEVARAIHESSAEFGVPEPRMVKVAWCESRFDPAAGRSHVGLFQQAMRYWRARVADFNARHRDYPVGPDPRNPFWNARVSADMMRRPGGMSNWRCRG